MTTYSGQDFRASSEFHDRHPHLFKSPNTLKHQIRLRYENGLAASGAIVESGKRFLICEPLYFQWLGQQVVTKKRTGGRW